MNRLKWSNVKLILNREVRDQLRDRRTLFMIAILPLLLYPLMGMSFMQLAQFLKKNPSRVLIVAEAPLPTDPAFIVDGKITSVPPAESNLLIVDYLENQLPYAEQAADKASAIIDEGTFDIVVCFPAESSTESGTTGDDKPTASGEISGKGTADESQESQSQESPVNLVASSKPLVYFNAAKDRSRIAYERMSIAITRWQRSRDELASAGQVAGPASTAPIRMATLDLANPTGRRAALWSKVLPFVALIWALTGAFYPAVDLCAGEKERGTLETLLSSPAERSEIVCGKLITIMLFSFATSALNLICMALTATFAVRQFAGLANGGFQTFGAPPLSSLAWLFLALIPIVALFSALALALATMARSTKEGQYYLMPLLLISMPLMMLAMFPSAELDLGTAIIPVTGVMLLLRNLMEGEYRQAIPYVLPVMGVTATCCFVAIRWAVDQFNDENVLFQDSERFSVGLWLRRFVTDRSPTPGFIEGFMCGILILLVRFFAGMSLPSPTDWNSFATIAALSLVAFVAAPAILMAVALTTEPRTTLALKPPRTFWSIPAAILLAICLHPVAIALLVLVKTMYPIDIAALAPFEKILGDAPLGSMLLLMAVLPAICEELAFRGYILSGLNSNGRTRRAIIISSLLFGFAHGVVQQSLIATVFGVVLGYIAIQTGSLLPCIAFHATHNALGICFSRYIPGLLERFPRLDGIINTFNDGAATYHYGPPVVLGAMVLSAWLLKWFKRLNFEPTLQDMQEAAHQSVHAMATQALPQ